MGIFDIFKGFGRGSQPSSDTSATTEGSPTPAPTTETPRPPQPAWLSEQARREKLMREDVSRIALKQHQQQLRPQPDITTEDPTKVQTPSSAGEKIG